MTDYKNALAEQSAQLGMTVANRAILRVLWKAFFNSIPDSEGLQESSVKELMLITKRIDNEPAIESLDPALVEAFNDALENSINLFLMNNLD